MSFKEFEAVRTEKVAGPQHETKSKNSVLPSTSSTPSPSPSTISATQEELHLQIYKIFPFIEISYRDLHRFISGLCKSVISSQLMQTINKYKNGCNENYTKVLESYDMCYKLSQNIVRTIDIFKELSTYLSDMEEYNYRLCEIMSIFIVCELRLSVDADQQEQHLIAQRIIYTMRKHLVQEDEYETLYNILRTLVYIPKLFNARDIMCAIFGEFIPLKPLPEVNVFPDKLYMLYIIVFYRWMMMQKDGDDKLLIVNFAESFMKPSVSLCTNNLYCPYLPMYTTHSTATRTILNNLKYYRDVRNASIIDNALKRNGVVVNLCDDEEDDIIIIGSPTTDFAQIFASVRGRGNIKLEEKTVVEMVDLTEEEEHITSRIELHDKWLNEFHKLAKQYRESQFLFEKQLNNQLISNGEEGAVICLDSDSEGEEEISSNINKETTTTATQENNTEDLFVDNYPITNTPLNCDSDLDPFDAEDENDGTKISPRFLSGSLRTYPAKRSNLLETEDKIAEQTTEDKITEETENKITDSDEQYTSEDLDKIYRRDSIHISSPPKGSQIEEEDEGTDVQDENDDGESQSDTFLPTTIQTTEKEIRPMGPYPTYGNMRNDNPKTKTPKKQKKRVQFNNDPLGPTSSSVLPILPLKPAIQQTAHKSSDSTENYRLHGFNRFTGAPNNDDDTNSVHLKSTDSVESYRIRGFNRYDDENSVLSSASSTSSIKQQDHIQAGSLFFRQPYPGPFSPSISSAPSRSLSTPSRTRKKNRVPKNKEFSITLRRKTVGNKEDLLNSNDSIPNSEEQYSIIRNRSEFNDEYNTIGAPGMSSYGESSDDYNDVHSYSSMVINERHKSDAKLRKRCKVLIEPNEKLVQLVRKRDEMYIELLKNQRKQLELNALEKQREKERRRPGHREEKNEPKKYNSITVTTIAFDETMIASRRSINYDISSESEHETNFKVRTRKPIQQYLKESLNKQIDTTESTTTTLLSQIDAHLDKPAAEKCYSFKINDHKQVELTNTDINQQSCDINTDEEEAKMNELNLLADAAQHLSPYQLDLPENNPPRTPSPAKSPLLAVPQIPNNKEVPKEKVKVTEQLIIQSLDNLFEKRKPHLCNEQQQQASTCYAHDPKLNIAAIFKSSPHANLLHHNHQYNTQLENNDNNVQNNSMGEEMNPEPKTDETLEQILVKSISALKSVTNFHEPSNESNSIRQEINTDATVPLLISNVESLNQFEQNDVVIKRKFDDKVNLMLRDSTEQNSEKFLLATNSLSNKETNEKNKDVIEHNENNERAGILSSDVLNIVESPIICASNPPNIHNKEVAQNCNIPSLMTNVSNISFESEISKPLPEIAEPSPVVTDISDNSNESDVSKNFGLHIPLIINANTDTVHRNEISTPDLSLVMSNISHSTTSQHETLESGFNPLNCTLNTPTKISVAMSREELANSSNNELNTPLKFGIQPEFESNSMPLKNNLETETDNNVTKFLDLILNKTVSNAESETSDKIIKELNALITDIDMPEKNSNNAIIAQEATVDEEGRDQPINYSIKLAEEKPIEKKITADSAVLLKPQTNLAIESNKFPQPLEYSSNIHIENNCSSMEIVESNLKESISKNRRDSQIPSANNELNPPKENLKEGNRAAFLSNVTLMKLPSSIPPFPSNSTTMRKSSAIKQIFNIKCRVRLKRLDKDCHFKKPLEEPISSNNDIKCDTATGKKLQIKKSCLKSDNKPTNKKNSEKISENFINVTSASDAIPIKKPKLDVEKSITFNETQTSTQQPATQMLLQTAYPSPIIYNTTSITKPKNKPTKTVTFGLPNLSEELRPNTASNNKQKNPRTHRKMPDNTLRAAETLQFFVNTINDSTRTPPFAEFNKKRSPIKNKCIAEDETPRPPPASTLTGTPPCKKSCIEKSQITTSKCKDQQESSLTTPSISSISGDIATARIYTSSPLDQTLPEYDDNVDTVADTELILPTTTGNLQRKLKRSKKLLLRPEPADDISTDDISNQPGCHGEDDTDAVVDNEDDEFAEELLPIPAANEHILEEIVSNRPSHIGTGTVIRDDYMNIEATDTVPVYLFNDESRDLGSPEPIQSSDNINVVDSSSYLNTSSATAPTNVAAATTATTTSAMDNIEKPMLSPSEHEVSSTQETFYQTPTKNKQTEMFGEKSSTSKDKGNSSSTFTTSGILKQKPEDNNFKNKEDYQTSNIGLLQNNQVDTTNHSPEMCTLALTATTTTTTALTSNRKIHKSSTRDEMLFNELQLQQPTSNTSNKRKSKTSFCVESTSDNKTAVDKTTSLPNNIDVISNESLPKVDDGLKKLLKEVSKIDNQTNNETIVGQTCASNNGGGSSPSTTTTINENKSSKSKSKKQKSNKSSKSERRRERSSKIVLKVSKLATYDVSSNPLKITIPTSILLRPPSTFTPPTQIESQGERQQNDSLNTLTAKLFAEKNKEPITTPYAKNNNHNQHQNVHVAQSHSKKEFIKDSAVVTGKSKRSQSRSRTPIAEPYMQNVTHNVNSTTVPSALTTKKTEKQKSTKSCTNTNNDDLIFVKDKYDLIKSKDKQNKEKSKEKTNQSQFSIQNNTRVHKISSKEKIKGEKGKEKSKSTEKSTANNKQPGSVVKFSISQNNTNSLNSSPSPNILSSTSTTKQSNNKSSKNNSSSSLSSSSVMLKSKTNLPVTESSVTATATNSPEVAAATLLTNNLRKKLKIK